jgi:hypothetical protein
MSLGGILNLANCLITGNQALGGAEPAAVGYGLGGGIYLDAGSATISSSTLCGNWSGWLLIAMNRHQLKQKEEAQRALRQGVNWIEEQKRRSEENPVLQFQFEMMRPMLESLRREAESLMEGKDPANAGVG